MQPTTCRLSCWLAWLVVASKLHSLLHSVPLSYCRTLLKKTERSCDSEVKISRAEAAGRDRGVGTVIDPM